MTKTPNPRIPGCGFHHVALRVSDFDRSVQFYTDVLGFREACAWGEGDGRAVMLDTGDGNYLELFATKPGSTPGPEAADRAWPIFHFALRTQDCDASLERARAAGMKVTMESKTLDIPASPPITVRIAFFKGPDGEVVELFQNEVL